MARQLLGAITALALFAALTTALAACPPVAAIAPRNDDPCDYTSTGDGNHYSGHGCGGHLCCWDGYDCGGVTPGCPAGLCCAGEAAYGGQRQLRQYKERTAPPPEQGP